MDFAKWFEVIQLCIENFDKIALPIGTLLVSLMTILRLISEVLITIADKTETDLDNKILAEVNTAIKTLAKIAAYFGVGKPKRLG